MNSNEAEFLRYEEQKEECVGQAENHASTTPLSFNGPKRPAQAQNANISQRQQGDLSIGVLLDPISRISRGGVRALAFKDFRVQLRLASSLDSLSFLF